MKTEIVFIQGLKREVTFYIGKNQSENFEVIDKGSPDDLWFHAKEVSSCHVVCELPENLNKKELAYIVTAGGLLCKNNTNKLKGLKNVEIIYTKIENVTKTKIPGCVITENEKKIIC
jgi:predicted ribosome quality control (RQC) complex YloA/Tae2 family protein